MPCDFHSPIVVVAAVSDRVGELVTVVGAVAGDAVIFLHGCCCSC